MGLPDEVEQIRLSVLGGVGRGPRVVTLVAMLVVGELHCGDVELPGKQISNLIR